MKRLFKVRTYLILLSLLTIIIGCSSGNTTDKETQTEDHFKEQKGTPKIDNNHREQEDKSNIEEDNNIDLPENVIEDVEHIVSVIRSGDAHAMQETIDDMRFGGMYGGEITGELIIKVYKFMIDLDTITYRFMEEESNIKKDQYTFILTGTKDNATVELELRFTYDKSGNIHYSSKEINHLPRMIYYVDRYVQALKDQDAEALAELLSYEAGFPVELSQETIDRYTSKVDVKTLEVEYLGLEQRQMYFIILGDNGSFEHEIYAVYGDGAVGVHDDLRPEYSY